MSTVERSVRGSLVSALTFAVHTGQALLLVPLVLSGWGAETYAIWLSCQACVSLLTTFDIGFQTYAGNEVAKQLHGELAVARASLGSSLRLTTLLGLLELAIAGLLVQFGQMERLFGNAPGAAANPGVADHVVLLSLLGPILVGSSTGIFARVYLSRGEFVRGAWWGLLQRLSLAAAVVAVALSGGGLLLAGALSSAVILVTGLAILQDCRRKFPDLLPVFERGSLAAGAAMFVASLALVVGNLIGQLQVHGLTLAVGSTLGAAALAAFATMRTLANTLTQAAAALLAPAVPELVRLDVTKAGAKLRMGLFSLNAVVNLPAAVASMALVLVGQPLYEFWTRHQIPYDRGVLHLVAVSVLVRVAGLPVAGHMIAMNDPRWLMLTTCAQTAVLFGLSWPLSSAFGLTGVALAMVVGECVGGLVFPAVWFARRHPLERGRWLADLTLSLTSPLVSALVLIASVLATGAHALPIVGVGAALQLVVLTLLFSRMPNEVRSYVRGILRLAPIPKD